jgi:chromate transport protein ChrA
MLPPTVMMLAVAAVLHRFQQDAWLQGFVGGMSPAVAALMIVVAWELFRAGTNKKISRRTLLIACLSAAALWFGLPSPLVLLGAGVLGVILFR